MANGFDFNHTYLKLSTRFLVEIHLQPTVIHYLSIQHSNPSYPILKTIPIPRDFRSHYCPPNDLFPHLLIRALPPKPSLEPRLFWHISQTRHVKQIKYNK